MSDSLRPTLQRWLFAHGCDRMLARYEEYIAERKQSLFANLSGTILEVGPGTGAI